ncbi:site-specific integrase [Pedobacter sp. Leaf132]|uniref:tyrosine-type recombinase/integrase n=1 Tax=Pedobacter sp. Leaf132 TaxID=2876557 RepID=UPI001E58F48C|nr:site-specific integrase [Pedobacter sp. Leaf132]
MSEVIAQVSTVLKHTKPTFYSFWQEQIQLWKLSKAENTLKTYRSTLNILKEFNPRLNFSDLTYDCIEKFELYLRSIRGNGVGGAFTKQKTLKSMINQAILKGHMKCNPYQNFKIKAAVGRREFLSIQEVKTIKDMCIEEKNGFLNRVRDIFLFSCFTSLRFSDTMNLKYGHIRQNPDRIEMEIMKTSKLLTIPLSANAGKILEKYMVSSPTNPKLSILPKMANQVINRELKVLIKKASIAKHISFHCARHSLASNLIESGTYINHVKELLGRTSMLQTQIYAKSLKADLYASVSRLNEFYQ